MDLDCVRQPECGKNQGMDEEKMQTLYIKSRPRFELRMFLLQGSYANNSAKVTLSALVKVNI